MTLVKTEYIENTKILILNQEKGNKFTIGMLRQVESELDEPDLTGVIITGNGNQFSVGGDLDGMIAAIENNNPEKYVEDVVPIVNSIIEKIISAPFPVIAAINGSAAGGGLSLAMSCDYRISVPGAKLSMAFGKLGLSPDSGSSILFPMRFGRFQALKGIATGKIYSAEEGLKFGAINEIVDRSDLRNRSLEICTELISESLWTFSQAKKLINYDIVVMLKERLNEEFELIRISSKREEYIKKVLGNRN